MSDHASFYEAIEYHGGVLDPAMLPPHLQELASFVRNCCSQVRDKINASQLLWPLGDTRIEMVANEDFNAFAHHDEGSEGIAIYSGLFKHLCELSIGLWSDEGLLSPGRVGWRANAILQEFLRRDEIEQWQTIPKTVLSDEHLMQRRINTALTALIYIFMHEVGHIVRAHIPFLARRSSIAFKTLYEHNNMSLVCSKLELQFFEIDADIYAAEGLTDSAFTTWKMGKVFPVNFSYPKGDTFSYLVDFYRGLFLAVFCLDQTSSSKALESSSGHPVPGVRLGVISIASTGLLNHPFGVDLKVALGAQIAAAMEIGDLFTKKRIPALTLEHDLTVILEKAGEMIGKAQNYLEGIQPSIDGRLLRMGRDPRHFDQFKDFYTKR